MALLIVKMAMVMVMVNMMMIGNDASKINKAISMASMPKLDVIVHDGIDANRTMATMMTMQFPMENGGIMHPTFCCSCILENLFAKARHAE